jgi:hypothetical protein
MKIKSNFILIIPIISIFFSGCIKEPNFTKDEQNISKPFNNRTYFSDAFKKLNRLLIKFNMPIYKIQVKTIENLSSAKGAMPLDSSSFLKTPIILNMNRIKLIAYEPIFNKYETKTTGFIYFPEMKKNTPQLVINGAITQFDKGIISKSENRDLDLEFGGGDWRSDGRFNYDNSDSFSQIALDLNIFRYKDRTFLSGVATSNKIEIHRKRRKNRFGFFLNGSGIGYSKYATLQQSKDEALRILSEYSLIQLLGRLYSIPYWKCTTPPMRVDEYVVDSILNNFKTAKESLRVKLIESLTRLYGYNIPLDGQISNIDLKILSIIAKKYKFKSKKILSPSFYKELYLNIPIS